MIKITFRHNFKMINNLFQVKSFSYLYKVSNKVKTMTFINNFKRFRNSSKEQILKVKQKYY